MRKASNIKYLTILFLFVLFSCVNGDSIEKIDYSYSFCDGNSKVWIVNNIFKGEEVLQTRNELETPLFVFYASGKCLMGTLNDFVNSSSQKGDYLLESENEYVEMNFNGEKWAFIFKFTDENHLLLRPEKKSKSDLSFELIPFPETN